MKPIVVRNFKPISWFNFGGITLYPFILIDSTAPWVLRHEWVHVMQVRRLGWFTFYFCYIVEHLIFGYQDNRFEIEAYAKQDQIEDPKREEYFLCG